MSALAAAITGPTLTEAGLRYAARNDESLIAFVALAAAAGDTSWPEEYRDVAILICNQEGEKEEARERLHH